MKDLVYLKDVVSLKLDDGKCTGCGMCMEVCPHNVFRKNDKHILIRDRDACMECGACSRNCPANALTVQAGVGCAAAVINTLLGRKDAACCCLNESSEASCSNKGTTCC